MKVAIKKVYSTSFTGKDLVSLLNTMNECHKRYEELIELANDFNKRGHCETAEEYKRRATMNLIESNAIHCTLVLLGIHVGYRPRKHEYYIESVGFGK